MEKVEYSILTEAFEWFLKHHDCAVDKIGMIYRFGRKLLFITYYLIEFLVYLQTRPEMVYQRLRNRNRGEELKIGLVSL